MENLEYGWAVLVSFIHEVVDRAKGSKKARTAFKLAGMVLILLAVIVAYTVVIMRVQAKRDAVLYEARLEQLRLELVQQAAASAGERMQDPYKLQLEAEAESVARVLYGVKDNDADDLRTYAWCVFNRVDNKGFPETLQDVIDQPKQWMRYTPDNPVLESLYVLALDEVTKWHEGHRPVSPDYVYMNWTATDIVLRDNWKDGSTTHYWRYE